MKDLKSMTKDELVAHIEALEAKLESNKDGRKAQVLDIIQREGKVLIKDIAAELEITDRNVSSQLSYLRKDGWLFGKDSKGRIYIEKED